jgi:hypothetical protein
LHRSFKESKETILAATKAITITTLQTPNVGFFKRTQEESKRETEAEEIEISDGPNQRHEFRCLLLMIEDQNQ